MVDDPYDDEVENYEDEEFEQGDEEYDVIPNASPADSPSRPDRRRRSSTAGARASQNGLRSPIHQSMPGSSIQANDFAPERNLTDAQRNKMVQRLKLALSKQPHVALEVFVMDDIYAMAPISQAELNGMGRSVYANKKVGSSQTQHDAKAVEVQTDEIDTGSQTCQAPEDLSHQSARDVAVRMTELDPYVERKLNTFISWAGPLVLAAMGMAPKTKTLAVPWDGGAGKGLGGGMSKLVYPALLANRPVNAIAYDPGSSPNLLVAYGPVNAQLGAAELLKDHSFGSRGCLAVWDLSELGAPAHVLVCEGTPTCCCWAPPPTVSVVFAGMDEGGVCVWDLEESTSRHPTEQIVSDQAPTTTRRPSFSTECLAHEASAAPIVAVSSLAKEGSRMTPCHVVSLTAWGEVTVYTLSILNTLELANADIDLGMRYGSKVRLLKTSSNIKLGMSALSCSANSRATQLLQTFSLAVFPGSSRLFIVGSDAGKVLRGSWVGMPPAPKEYRADIPATTLEAANAVGSMPQIASIVTSVHISPFCTQAFLAGHDDGTIVLHSSELSTPVYVWPGVTRGKVRVVRWSPSRPCAFFVLDATCTLYAFDLLGKNKAAPVYTETYMSQDPKTGIASFATTFETAHIFNGPTGPGDGKASFAVGYDDGRLDVHLFSKKHLLTEAGGNELNTLTELCSALRKPPKKVVPAVHVDEEQEELQSGPQHQSILGAANTACPLQP